MRTDFYVLQFEDDASRDRFFAVAVPPASVTQGHLRKGKVCPDVIAEGVDAERLAELTKIAEELQVQMTVAENTQMNWMDPRPKPKLKLEQVLEEAAELYPLTDDALIFRLAVETAVKVF